MKIWLISKYALTPETGNQEQRLFNIASALKERNDITLITSNSNHLGMGLPRQFRLYKEIKGDKYGFKIVYINAPQYESSTSFKRVWSWIIFEVNLFFYILLYAKTKPRVAFISSLSLLTIFNGLFLKIFYKTKFILDIRDIWPLTLIDMKGFKPYHPLILFLYFVEFIGYKLADKVTSTLEFFNTYNYTVRKKFTWLPQIYTPIQQTIVEYDFADIREKYPCIVCYSGSIGFMNHISILSDVVKLAVHDPIFFIVLGDGPELKEMQEKHQKDENILFLGKVRRNEIQSYLSQVDILLHLVKNEPVSLYDDYGFSPQKYLDYYLSGKPIILTDTFARIDEIQDQFIVKTTDKPEDIINTIKIVFQKRHIPSIQQEYLEQHHIMNDLYKAKLNYIFS